MLDVNIVVTGTDAESAKAKIFLSSALHRVSKSLNVEVTQARDAAELRAAALAPAVLSVISGHGGWYRSEPRSKWKLGIGSPRTTSIATPSEWFESPNAIGGRSLLVLSCDGKPEGDPQAVDSAASWTFLRDRLVIVGKGDIQQGDMSAAVRSFARFGFPEVPRTPDQVWTDWYGDMRGQGRAAGFQRAL